MFWGLIMEPGKKYSQTVQKSFHISHAALDLDTAHPQEPVQVLLGFDNRNYLVCSLQKTKWIQAPLDLNFQVGDTVSFATNGPGHVHLTGYLVPEDDFDMQGEEEESDEEAPELVPPKKRKAGNNSSETVVKKSKTAQLLEEINDDDSDDSDDSDVNLTDMLEGDEEAEDEESGDDEDGDDEEDGDDDDDNENEDEDESEEEQQMVKQKSPKKDSTPVKQNGVAKKDKTPKLQTPGKDRQTKSPQQNEIQQKGEKTPKGQKTPGKELTPMKKFVEGGVIIEDIKLGDGPVAKAGKITQVYYEGRLKSNNKMFDSSTKGPGFKFRLGHSEVIKGWDVGVAGMRVGGKRRITCPPHMAYGAKGSPPVIPPSSTLVFEVELKNVKN